ncbi:hypothetical protein [Dialister sp.]|uniref:hypothetical protein n=1 Tax=Dialister sp. TaxID=1955814 RepID=UPI003F0688DD
MQILVQYQAAVSEVKGVAVLTLFGSHAMLPVRVAFRNAEVYCRQLLGNKNRNFINCRKNREDLVTGFYLGDQCEFHFMIWSALS